MSHGAVVWEHSCPEPSLVLVQDLADIQLLNDGTTGLKEHLKNTSFLVLASI